MHPATWRLGRSALPAYPRPLPRYLCHDKGIEAGAGDMPAERTALVATLPGAFVGMRRMRCGTLVGLGVMHDQTRPTARAQVTNPANRTGPSRTAPMASARARLASRR